DPPTGALASNLASAVTQAEKDQLRSVIAEAHQQWTRAVAVNDRGQVVVVASVRSEARVFLTGPDQPINGNTIDLEVYDATRDYRNLDVEERERLGRRFGLYSRPPFFYLNNRGQVTGRFIDFRPVTLAGPSSSMLARAFRTAPNHPINPETDDLG